MSEQKVDKRKFNYPLIRKNWMLYLETFSTFGILIYLLLAHYKVI